MPENKCQECQRLWGEYVSAVLEHTRLDRQLYFTGLRQEPGLAQNVKTALEAAAIARDAARELIRKHEVTHRKADAAAV
jgi:hypothetical protein